MFGTLRRPRIEVCDGTEELRDKVRRLIFAQRTVADRIRKQRIVAIDSVGDFEALDVLIDDISPERDIAAHQELRHWAVVLTLTVLGWLLAAIAMRQYRARVPYWV